MSSLFYQGVFVLLIIQMSVFILFLLPIPLSWRGKILKTLANSTIAKNLTYTLRTLFIFVLVLFIDAIMKSMKAQEDVDTANTAGHHHDLASESLLKAKLFHAQRNIYLCGSVLFLSLVLGRFVSLMLELVRQEEKAEVLKAQAAKTSKEYLKLLDSSQNGQDDLKELQEMAERGKKAVKELEIVKKQAQQTADEYMKLTDRYTELERKLERKGENSKSK